MHDMVPPQSYACYARAATNTGLTSGLVARSESGSGSRSSLIDTCSTHKLIVMTSERGRTAKVPACGNRRRQAATDACGAVQPSVGGCWVGALNPTSTLLAASTSCSLRRLTNTGLPRHLTVTVCPISILDRSTSSAAMASTSFVACAQDGHENLMLHVVWECNEVPSWRQVCRSLSVDSSNAGNKAHRHGKDELQHSQPQSRGVDEAAARQHKVGECPLAGVARGEALVRMLIVAAHATQHSFWIGNRQHRCQVTEEPRQAQHAAQAHLMMLVGFFAAYTVGGRPEAAAALDIS